MQWLKFVNRGGIPALHTVAVNVDTTNSVVTFSFNDHPYRQTNNFYGAFFVKITQSNPTTGAEAYTVKFDTQGVGGSAVDVYQPNGTQATANELTSTGQSVYLCFYDRDSNRVQIIG